MNTFESGRPMGRTQKHERSSGVPSGRAQIWAGALLAAATSALAVGCEDETVLGDVQPGLSVEPTAIDFGAVQLGTTASREVFVRNTGTGTLEVSVAAGNPFPGAYRFDIDRDTVPPSGVAALTVRFTPEQLGDFPAELLLTTNANEGETISVGIKGAGVSSTLSVMPQQLDFRNVVVGTTKTLPVVVTNNGDSEAEIEYLPGLNIRPCSSSAADPAQFCVRFQGRGLDENNRFRLASGETADLEVQFSPRIAGTRADGQLSLQSCASSACEVRVGLTGVAVEAGLRCQPPTIDFGQINPGSSISRTVTCENIANEAVTVVSWNIAAGSSPAFSVESSTPLILSEGESLSVEATFAPSDLSDASGVLDVETDNPNPSLRKVSVALRGSGGGPEIDIIPPEINFGRVSLLAPSRRSFVIVNSGFNTLTVSNIEVDTDGTQSFSSPDADIAVLEPGQSKAVTVQFDPREVGIIESKVRITSNDADEPSLEIPVRGEGVNLPPCNFSVAPSLLQFGSVQVTRTLRRSFQITNNGSDICLLTAIRMVGGSTRAFSIPEGDIISEEIAPGASRTVTVEFAPQSQGTFSGQLEFSISSPTSPFNTIDLLGVGAGAGLLVSPSELDFGTIEVGCSTRERTITLYNTGTANITIDSINLAVPVIPEFRVSNRPPPLPSSPLTVAPGQSATFNVRFTANAVSQYASAVEIVANINGAMETYIAALDGEGALDARQIDEFQQLGKPAVDILFIVDKTTSMTQEQDSLAANFASFIRFAEAQGLDYQISSTTTNTQLTGTDRDEAGRITSAPAGSMRSSSVLGPLQNRIVTPRTLPSPAAVFSANVSYQLTGGPPSEESGLRGAELALSPPNITGHNAGILRPDAVFSLIFVSDAQDHSSGTVDFYTNFFRSIKGFRNTNLFSASAVAAPTPPGASRGNCSGPGGSAYAQGRYQEVVRQTGGVFVSICTGDWSRALEELGQTAFGFKSRFFLTNQPAVGSLKVIIDGMDLPRIATSGAVNWNYDLGSNSINFAAYATPEPGSQIRVEYAAECL